VERSVEEDGDGEKDEIDEEDSMRASSRKTAKRSDWTDEFKSYDGEVVPAEDIERGISHYNLFDVQTEPRRKRTVFKTKRDHNGDLMTHRDMELARRSLWQRSRFMAPVIMSPSLEVKKDALINLVRAAQKAMRDGHHKVDQSMEQIMLSVVKEEAERAGIEMSEFDISEITKLVDINLITKIEGYKKVN
jgi:hypothetical protein